MTNTCLHGAFFPRKPYPIPNQNEQSVYPFLDRKSAKTISFGLAYAYVAYSVYSCVEKGCRKKCTRQSRKVLWVVFSSLFFKEISKNGKKGHGRMFASAKGKQQKQVRDSRATVSGTVY